MTTQTLVWIFLIHFLADFALQTHEQAVNKSTSIKWLTYHVATYSLVWTFYMLNRRGIIINH